MGEPAGLSFKQLAETVELAKRIVESVRADEEFLVPGLSEEWQMKILLLAQVAIRARLL